MAKIEEKVTYDGKICKFKKTIGNISFYSYDENEDEVLLLVNKTTKDVMAKISINSDYGNYGLVVNGYNIEND